MVSVKYLVALAVIASISSIDATSLLRGGAGLNVGLGFGVEFESLNKGVSSIFNKARGVLNLKSDIISKLLNLKQPKSFDGTIDVGVDLCIGYGRIINKSLIPGFGDLLSKIYVVISKILFCVKQQTNCGICSANRLGIGQLRGDINIILKQQGLLNCKGQLEALIKKHSGNRGLKYYTRSQQVVLNAALKLAGFLTAEITVQQYTDVLVQANIIFGAIGKTFNNKDGDNVASGFWDVCNQYLGQYGCRKFTKADRDELTSTVKNAENDKDAFSKDIESNTGDSGSETGNNNDGKQQGGQQTGNNNDGKQQGGQQTENNNDGKQQGGEQQGGKNTGKSNDSDESDKNNSNDSNESNESSSSSGKTNIGKNNGGKQQDGKQQGGKQQGGKNTGKSNDSDEGDENNSNDSNESNESSSSSGKTNTGKNNGGKQQGGKQEGGKQQGGKNTGKSNDSDDSDENKSNDSNESNESSSSSEKTNTGKNNGGKQQGGKQQGGKNTGKSNDSDESNSNDSNDSNESSSSSSSSSGSSGSSENTDTEKNNGGNNNIEKQQGGQQSGGQQTGNNNEQGGQQSGGQQTGNNKGGKQQGGQQSGGQQGGKNTGKSNDSDENDENNSNDTNESTGRDSSSNKQGNNGGNVNGGVNVGIDFQLGGGALVKAVGNLFGIVKNVAKIPQQLVNTLINLKAPNSFDDSININVQITRGCGSILDNTFIQGFGTLVAKIFILISKISVCLKAGVSCSLCNANYYNIGQVSGNIDAIIKKQGLSNCHQDLQNLINTHSNGKGLSFYSPAERIVIQSALDLALLLNAKITKNTFTLALKPTLIIYGSLGNSVSAQDDVTGDNLTGSLIGSCGRYYEQKGFGGFKQGDLKLIGQTVAKAKKDKKASWCVRK